MCSTLVRIASKILPKILPASYRKRQLHPCNYQGGGLMEDEKPFDAAESYLCDAPEGAMAKWRTSSLVTAVRGILERKPQFEHHSPSARLQAFHAAADEL